jgi:hypothetical protein
VTDVKGVATHWLEGLAARGVAVSIRNGRLWLQPASAYHALSDDEVLVLRHHRQAIKDAIKAGVSLDVARVTPTEKPTPAPEPPCAYCGQAPCIGPEHYAYQTLHANDPVEVARRDKEATRVMMAQIRRPLPEWYK